MFLIRGTWTSPCWFGWYRFDFIHSQAEKASEVTHVLCFGEELSGITVSGNRALLPMLDQNPDID